MIVLYRYRKRKDQVCYHNRADTEILRCPHLLSLIGNQTDSQNNSKNKVIASLTFTIKFKRYAPTSLESC